MSNVRVLTSTDQEPPDGSEVMDAERRRWCRVDGQYGGAGRANWFPLEDDGSFDNDDPESWTKVAGNYGPVRVVRVGPATDLD